MLALFWLTVALPLAADEAVLRGRVLGLPEAAGEDRARVEAWPVLIADEVVRRLGGSEVGPEQRVEVGPDGWYTLRLASAERWRLVARGPEGLDAIVPMEITVLAQRGTVLLPPVRLVPGRRCAWERLPPVPAPSGDLPDGGGSDSPLGIVAWQERAPSTDPLAWRPAVQFLVPDQDDGGAAVVVPVALDAGRFRAAGLQSGAGPNVSATCADLPLQDAADAAGLVNLLGNGVPAAWTAVDGPAPAVSRAGGEAALRTWLAGRDRELRRTGRFANPFPFLGFGPASGALAPPEVIAEPGAAPGMADMAIVGWKPDHLPVQAHLAAERTGTWPLTLRRAGRLEGRVLDPSGRPVEGAEVRIAGLPGYWVAGSVLLLQTITAADGYYMLSGLPPGDFHQVVAAKGGLGRAGASVLPFTETVVARRQDLVLKHDVRISGVFEDAAGRPIGGVDLGVTSRGNAAIRIGPPAGWPRGGTTNPNHAWAVDVHDDGRFRVVVPTEIDPTGLVLVGWHEDHVPVVVPLPAPTAAGEIDLGVLVMEPGRRIEGVVVDRGGELIQGAVVSYARASASRRRLSASPMINPAAAAAAAGRFVIGGVRADERFHLRASADGYVRGSAFEVGVADTPVEIVLDEGLEVVLEFPDGERDRAPCASIWLRPSRQSDAGGVSRDCTSELRQTLRGVAPTSWIIEIQAPSKEIWRRQVELVEDTTIPVELRPAAAAVTGEVAADGVPLGRARVRIGGVEAVTAADGEYSLRVRTGPHTADVLDPRSGDITSRSVELEAGANRLLFDLTRRRFAGRVVDAAGAPVAEANISLSAVRGSDYLTTLTDGDGFFAFEARAADYRARVSSRRGGSVGADIDLREASIEGHVFRVEDRRHGTIDITTSPLRPGEAAEASISRSPLEHGARRVPEQAPGVFSLRPALGEWFLAVETTAGRRGFASVELTERRPSARVEVRLGEHALAGQVRVEGASTPGVAVFLVHEETLGVRSTLSAGDGAFVFAGAQPGRYLMMAEGVLQAVRVPWAGGPVRFDVELGEVEIAVPAPAAGSAAGSAPASAEMWPERLGRDMAARLGVLRRLVVGVPGAVRAGRVPIGRYLLAADVPGVGRVRDEITVRRGPNRHEIDLSSAAPRQEK